MSHLRVRRSNPVLALSLGALLLLSPGCAQKLLTGRLATYTASDIKSAVIVADASKALLPPGDPLGLCLASLASTLDALQAGPGIQTPVNGLVTEAARLYVLDTIARNIPPDIRNACGAILFSMMLRAGQRLPGL